MSPDLSDDPDPRSHLSMSSNPDTIVRALSQYHPVLVVARKSVTAANAAATAVKRRASTRASSTSVRYMWLKPADSPHALLLALCTLLVARHTTLH